MSLEKKNKSRTSVYMLYMKRPLPCYRTMLSHPVMAPDLYYAIHNY